MIMPATVVAFPVIFGAVAFVLRAMFQEMADEMLLASTRVRPQRLLEAGFSFAHPELEEAMRVAVSEE